MIDAIICWLRGHTAMIYRTTSGAVLFDRLGKALVYAVVCTRCGTPYLTLQCPGLE